MTVCAIASRAGDEENQVERAGPAGGVLLGLHSRLPVVALASIAPLVPVEFPNHRAHVLDVVSEANHVGNVVAPRQRP